MAHFFRNSRTDNWMSLSDSLWCYPFSGHYLQQELRCFVSCNSK